MKGGTRNSAAVVLLLLGQLLVLPSSGLGATTYYDFTVNYGYNSPDFVEKMVLTINDQFPGPTIRVKAGDRVEVKVRNELFTEGLVIHWHGMRQRKTPWADGTGYVTQCPILPGETFTYKFTTEQPGTFFYHGHHGMQRAAGLYGSFIVEPRRKEDEPFTYDVELNALVGDWYHRSSSEQLIGLIQREFRWVGNPQSLLINGRGQYNCSLIPTNPHAAATGDEVVCNSSLATPTIFPVVYGKTYRLRIASTASLATLNFLLEGHNFTVVEADGHYVEPLQTSSLFIFPGESYSILFNATEDPSRNYWAALFMRERNSTIQPGLAVLSYLPNSPLVLPPTAPPTAPAWDYHVQNLKQHQAYVALKGTEVTVPIVVNRRLILLNTLGFAVDGRLRWAINNVSYEMTETPALAALKYNLTDDSSSPANVDEYTPGYDIYSVPEYQNVGVGSRIYMFELNDVVDIILQNTNTLTPNMSEVHPWHMHGHDFWVLGYGSGVFDPSKDYETLNYVNPPLRNTVPLFPYGWTALRFIADNFGAWNFHCHVESHHLMGMAIIMAEGLDELPDIPKEALGCGKTKREFRAL